MNIKRTVDYLVELNVLKKTARQGWRIAGPLVESDTVASHVMMVAQIAYILGRMEGLDAQKCLALGVFHDNPETRIGERDKVSNHYLEPEISQADLKAAADQTDLLPAEIGREILEFIREANYGKSAEAQVVKDADIFEASLQARIFDLGGTVIPKNLLRKYLDEKRVKTASAKKLMIALRQRRELITQWFKNLRM
jgi:putative hydrolase of HD superfamily